MRYKQLLYSDSRDFSTLLYFRMLSALTALIRLFLFHLCIIDHKLLFCFLFILYSNNKEKNMNYLPQKQSENQPFGLQTTAFIVKIYH